MKSEQCFLFFICFLNFLTVSAQDQYRAVHWDREDGLSNGLVTCMLKDAKGFLWIATEGGLDRFDGNSFKNYSADKNNRHTIIDNSVKKLIEDSLHNIWVGTPKGMSRYDIQADTFSHFFPDPALPEKDVLPFAATGRQVYCIESFSLITVYDARTLQRKILLKLTSADNVYNGMGVLYTIFDPRSNSIWMLEGEYAKPGGGLYQISMNTGERKHYAWPCYRNIPGHTHWSEAMRYDPKRNCLWINSPDGLMQFTLRDKQFHHIDAMNDLLRLKDYNRFVGIDLDMEGRVWLATHPKGIVMYDPDKRSVTFPFGNDSILQKDVSDANLTIYCDGSDMVWSGFWLLKGLYQLIPFSRAVKQYTGSLNVPGRLFISSILNAVNGSNGTVWMGTAHGLNIFDSQKETFEMLHEKDLPGFKGEQIVPAGIDTSAQKAWLHSEAGLFEMDMRTHRCKRIIFEDVNFKKIQHARVIRPLFYGGYGQIDHGCIIPVYVDQKLSMFVVNSDSAIGHQIVPNERFYYEGTVVCNNKYLFLQSGEKTTVTYINQNGNWVRMPNEMERIKRRRIIYSKRDSTFWVGADRTLFHFDKSFHLIRSYSQKDGLPPFDMYNFIADNKGNIWFTTDRFISQLNVTSGKITSLTEIEGFKKQYFSPGACAMTDASGDLYFMSGVIGNQGFAKVNPGKINLSYPPSTVYIKSLELNQHVFPFPEGAQNPGRLSLKYSQNNISIATGTIDFYSKGTNLIRYKLEGLNNSWQYAPANYIIRYDGLPPRQYRLVMQASTVVGDFNGPEKSMVIQVVPPFWNTWWFYASMGMVLATGIYMLFRYRLQQKINLLEMRNRISQDLHDEIGASISGINLLSQMASEKLQNNNLEEASAYLFKVKNYTQDVIEKLGDMVWIFNPQNDSIERLLLRLKSFAGSIALSKNIQVHFETDNESEIRNLPIRERKAVYLISKEALNNIFKYAACSNAYYSLHTKASKWRLVIKDDGRGFIPEENNGGNGLRNMAARAHEIGANFYIQSQAGAGTIITVEF